MICIFKSKYGAVAALIAAAVVCLGSPAQAQRPSEEQLNAVRSSCRSDFLSNCSGVPRGGKEALDCLRQNLAKLSPACGSAVKATMPQSPPPPPPAAAAPPPAAPPPAAVAAPPPAAPPPPAAAASSPHPAAAPAPPQRAVAPATPKAAKPKMEKAKIAAPPPPPPAAAAPPPVETPTAKQLSAIKFTCRRDFKRHCRGVTQGGPEAIACLRRNAATLTPACKTSLADIGDAAPPAGLPLAPSANAPNAPVVMTAVIGRACLRDLLLHCRGTGIGDGQKIACLLARSPKLAPLCRAALKITEPVR